MHYNRTHYHTYFGYTGSDLNPIMYMHNPYRKSLVTRRLTVAGVSMLHHQHNVPYIVWIYLYLLHL